MRVKLFVVIDTFCWYTVKLINFFDSNFLLDKSWCVMWNVWYFFPLCCLLASRRYCWWCGTTTFEPFYLRVSLQCLDHERVILRPRAPHLTDFQECLEKDIVWVQDQFVQLDKFYCLLVQLGRSWFPVGHVTLATSKLLIKLCLLDNWETYYTTIT